MYTLLVCQRADHMEAYALSAQDEQPYQSPPNLPRTTATAGVTPAVEAADRLHWRTGHASYKALLKATAACSNPG